MRDENNVEALQFLLILLSVVVSLSLHTIYCAAAVSFLFVVIDVQCSVVILWKMRREGKQLLQKLEDEVADAEVVEQQCCCSRSNNDNDHANDNDATDDDEKEKKLREEEEDEENQDQDQRDDPHCETKTNCNCEAEEEVEDKEKNDCDCESEGETVAVTSRASSSGSSGVATNTQGVNEGTQCCSSATGSRTGSKKMDLQLSPHNPDWSCSKGDPNFQGEAFGQMFPLGGCIVVLTIYLISRTGTYHPYFSVSRSSLSQQNSRTQSTTTTTTSAHRPAAITQASASSVSSDSKSMGSDTAASLESEPSDRDVKEKCPPDRGRLEMNEDDSSSDIKTPPPLVEPPSSSSPTISGGEDDTADDDLDDCLGEDENSCVVRDDPIIELLDVIKGDFTSRAVRIKSGVVISERYEIEKEIGRGGFSRVYLATDKKYNRKVAVKMASRLLNQTKLLKKELGIYEDLQRSANQSSKRLSIPYLIHYTETDIKRTSVLVMDLLGPSMEDLFEDCGKKFAMGTVARFMEQMLDILMFFHERKYIHRDIKPENILVGRLGTRDASRIYLIDFGIASSWCNSATGKHIKNEYGQARLGTNSFMSMNAHRGKTQSRKDDLEALGYCMIFFLKTQFPWSRYDDMADGIKSCITMKMKSEMNFQEEFPVPEYPEEVAQYLQYVKDLPFEARPEYEMLKQRFRALIKRLKKQDGWDGFEWTKPEFLEKHPQWIIKD